MLRVDNTRVGSVTPLISPAAIKAKVQITPRATATVVSARKAIGRILSGLDPRLLVIVGPCSIHDAKAAEEYAIKAASWARKFQDTMLVVMRFYDEKPRTFEGWKGLIQDPFLNGSSDLAAGLEITRTLLLKINELGLPAATEWLGPITPAYLSDLIAWASIGARTTESQTHREMASGLSMPVGMKNGTAGDCEIAMNAIAFAQGRHSFIGVDQNGTTSIIKTTGNPDCHLILRGGDVPNYSAEDIAKVTDRLKARSLCPRVVVDCSHGNSRKDWRNQAGVWRDVVSQRVAGNADIVGVMLESNLRPGKQSIPADLSKFDPATLEYGVSVTDACVGLDLTEELLSEAASQMEAMV